MATGEVITDEWLPTNATRAPQVAPAIVPPPAARPAADRVSVHPSAAVSGTASGTASDTTPTESSPLPSITIPLGTSLADAETQLIRATLHLFNNHKERTAAVLGVSLKTLYNRLKEYTADEADGVPADASLGTNSVSDDEPSPADRSVDSARRG